ncbi:hypothetical protein BJV78DRAFT_859819 [Lactifluus subvellereus]|nr:hypothetical protein BJV78DRAFT_859819 [Lactifluus subvellereus]
MQPAPTPPQSYTSRRDNFPYISGYPQGLSPARIPNTIPPSFQVQVSQPMVPLYDAQSHTGTFIDPTSVPPRAGHCNGPYAGSLTLGHGLNYNTTANLNYSSLGTGSESPPLYRDQHTMPSVLHDYFGQGASNDAGHTFAAEQFPSYPMNFPHFLPRAYTTPNNESASPVWRLFNCWVGYEEQDELHLTIVFKRIPRA